MTYGNKGKKKAAQNLERQFNENRRQKAEDSLTATSNSNGADAVRLPIIFIFKYDYKFSSFFHIFIPQFLTYCWVE